MSQRYYGGQPRRSRARSAVPVSGASWSAAEGERLVAQFSAEAKDGGVGAVFMAMLRLFRECFYRNGILGGLQVLLIIIWQNFIERPFIKLRNTFRLESMKKQVWVGAEDSRARRPDWMIPLFAGVLMVIGAVLMYALSPQWVKTMNQSYGTEMGESRFFIYQIIYYVIGIVAFCVAATVSLKWFYKFTPWFLVVGFGACILLSGLGFLSNVSGANIPPAKCEKGACRWLEVGSLSVQPAEILKFAVMIALSVYLSDKMLKGKTNNWRESLLPALLLVGAMVAIIALPPQKDLGTALSALAIVVFQVLVAGINKRNSLILGAVVVVAGSLLIVSAPHRRQRIMTFGKKEDCTDLGSADKEEEYHICRAKIAIGSGGLVGSGIGRSVSTAGYLPESINDSVFAAVGEISGFAGSVGVLALYVALILRLVRLTGLLENYQMRLLVAGVAGWFSVHTFMNIAAITGLIPLTGITVPLISYGGTSIVFISTILGLAFNASRWAKSKGVIKEYKEAKDENLGSRRRVGRSRHSRGGSF